MKITREIEQAWINAYMKAADAHCATDVRFSMPMFGPVAKALEAIAPMLASQGEDEARSLLAWASEVCLEVVKQGDHAAHNAANLKNRIDSFLQRLAAQPVAQPNDAHAALMKISKAMGNPCIEIRDDQTMEDALAEYTIAILRLYYDALRVQAEKPVATGVPEGWIAVPDLYAMVTADHPQTCLNPDKVFEVAEVKRDSLGWCVRGENTCWFGLKMIAAAPTPKGDANV